MTTSEALSAQGTRLNRRGRENRQKILTTAIRCLSAGRPDAVSANRIAKEAGVTWGTIQHQFGDTDGVWAAVIEQVVDELTAYRLKKSTRQQSLSHRVSSMVEWLWRAFDSPPARAVQTIRMGLHTNHALLAEEFPKTAAAIELTDEAWSLIIEDMLEGIVASRTKVERMRQLLPAAMHGIHTQAQLSSLTNAEAAKRGLADAVTAYLDG